LLTTKSTEYTLHSKIILTENNLEE